MRNLRPDPGGAGLLSAPPGLPEQLLVDLDGELFDLLCDEPGWLDRTFDEIVAANWAEPPRRPGRSAARPRRDRARRRFGARRSGAARDLWCSRPQGRQRSPPAG